MEYLNINTLYSAIAIGIISYFIYLGSWALFVAFVVMSHAHYVLSYLWTVRYNLKLLFVLIGTALFFLAVFKSALSTDLIVLITSFAFNFHFWTDEVKKIPNSKYKSIREAHFFVGAILIAGLTLLAYLQLFDQYIQLIPTAIIYKSIVIFHAIKWIFRTHKKWSGLSRQEYIQYLLSVLFAHALFFILIWNVDTKSSVFLTLFEIRALYTWGLIHITYTFINRRLKQQSFLAEA